jgi:hypothetical protein
MGRVLGWCMSISRIPQTVAPAIVAAIHEPLVFLFVSNLSRSRSACCDHCLAAADALAAEPCDEQIGRPNVD